MARLLVVITVESVIACLIFVAGVWLLNLDGTLTGILAAACFVIGFLMLTHLILAAAFGRLATPFDWGAGHRVPGSPDPGTPREED